MIREYKEEIERLRQMLASFNQAGVNLNAMSAFMQGSSKSMLNKDVSPQQIQKAETESAKHNKEESSSVLAAAFSEQDGSPRPQGDKSPRFNSAPMTNESVDSLNFAALASGGRLVSRVRISLRGIIFYQMSKRPLQGPQEKAQEQISTAQNLRKNMWKLKLKWIEFHPNI